LVTSGFHDYTPVWSDVFKMQVLTGKDYICLFLEHISKTIAQLGHDASPVSREVWDIVVETWVARHDI